MQKTMIVVRGVKNVGKSGSIRLAYNDLCTMGEVVYGGRRTEGKEVNGAILKIDDVLVGVASKGDHATHVCDFVPTLIEAGCEVIVCASHTERSDSWIAACRLASEHDFLLDPINKTACPEDNDGSNRFCADDIIERVREALVRARLELVGA